VPTGRLEVVNANIPADTGCTFAASVVLPSVKVTVPPVTGSPFDVDVTVAVRVTGCPKLALFGETINEVFVAACVTVKLVVPVTPYSDAEIVAAPTF
jgi:hypothetical protein